MKTSKILLPGIFALMFLTACQKEEPVAENVSIEFEKDEFFLNGGMNTVKCMVTAQGTWSISSKYDWIVCDHASVSGKETIQISISVNTEDNDHRAGFLTFSCNGQRKSIWLKQSPYKQPTITQTEYTCLCPGDTFKIQSTYNLKFETDQTWSHIDSNERGNGYYITFDRNNTFDPDTINIRATDGRNTWAYKLTRLGSTKDCQGNVYGVTRIGNRYWLATNLRTTKYDSDSPLAGQIIPEREEEINMMTTSFTNEDYYPYYVSNFEWWNPSYPKPSTIRMGYVYNWQAAVGYYSSMPTDYYKSEIQGICPNGWHIATQSDWEAAIETCQSHDKEFYDMGLFCTAMHGGSMVPFINLYIAKYWCPSAVNGEEFFTTETTGGVFIIGNNNSILYLSYGYPEGKGYYDDTHRKYLSTDMRYTLSVRAVYNNLAE